MKLPRVGELVKLTGRIRHKEVHWSSFHSVTRIVKFNPLHQLYEGTYTVIGRVMNPRCAVYRTMLLEVAEIRRASRKREVVDAAEFGGKEYAKYQFVHWMKMENLTDKQAVIYGI